MMEKRYIKSENICLAFSVIALISFVIWAMLFLRNVNCIQKDVFFGDSNDWFMDFYNPVYYSVGRSPYTWGELYHRNQLPTTYMFLNPFSRLFPYSVEVESSNVAYTARYSQFLSVGVTIFLIVSCAVLFYVLYRRLMVKEILKILTLCAMFCSSIMLFALERANTQILASGLLFIFLAYYQSEDKIKHNIALFAFALSVSLKIAFAVFGILLIYEKNIKDIIKTVVFFAAIFALSLIWIKGDVLISIKNWIRAMVNVYNAAPTGWMGINQETILNVRIDSTLIKYALLLVGLVAGQFLQGWKKTLLICLMAIETVFACAEYGLIILFYPMVMFMNVNHEKKDIFYFICFLLLVSPIQYSFSNSVVVLTQRRLSNTVCIVMLITLIVAAIANCVRKIDTIREKSSTRS